MAGAQTRARNSTQSLARTRAGTTTAVASTQKLSRNAAYTVTSPQASSSSSPSHAPSRRPRNKEPSYLSRETPYISDTTGPIHHSLRGSRPVLCPIPMSELSQGQSGEESKEQPQMHASNPSMRPTGPLEIKHEYPSQQAAHAWAGERKDVMRTQTQSTFTSPDRTSLKTVASQPAAGSGGRLDASRKASQAHWPTAAHQAAMESLYATPSPTQSLHASRAQAARQAAETLAAKERASLEAASRLFATSAEVRHRQNEERMREEFRPASNTNPFFLGQGQSPKSKELVQRRMEARTVVGRSAAAALSPSNASGSSRRTQSDVPIAGYPTSKMKKWENDPSMRLVARDEASRSSDRFTETFHRVFSAETQLDATAFTSSMKESLEQGLKGKGGGDQQEFVPHFLKKVHPSLHDNVQRNIFNNGNDLIDPITSTSKFRRAKFEPRCTYDPTPSPSSSSSSSSSSSQSASASASAAAASTPSASTSSASQSASVSAGGDTTAA